jgi:hypothetical protein
VIFARGVVTRLRQNHGVAERLQFVGQALHRIGEDRIGDRRHQHADRTGAGPGQRNGELVGHIAEFPHRGFDPAPCFRRHQIRQAHHAAYSNRRYPVEIAQRWLETAGNRDLVPYLAGKLTTGVIHAKGFVREFL